MEITFGGQSQAGWGERTAKDDGKYVHLVYILTFDSSDLISNSMLLGDDVGNKCYMNHGMAPEFCAKSIGSSTKATKVGELSQFHSIHS